MASPVGGRFKFSPNVHLGLKNTTGKVAPGAIVGDLNIEAFAQVTKPGSRASGFQQAVTIVDTVKGNAAPKLTGSGTNQTLTGRQLTLFGGNYKVVDTQTAAGNTALIQAGSGRQTVEGATGDTLIGGSGFDTLTGAKGDRIGVGFLSSKTHTVAGSLLEAHRGKGSGNPVAFGTNNASVTGAVKYNLKTGTAKRETSVLGSNAHVTVTNFVLGSDSLFFKNETKAAEKDVVFTAKAVKVDGLASSQIYLPDGTQMTLVGVSVTKLHNVFSSGAHLFVK